MFYKIANGWFTAEVYGLDTGGKAVPIDPYRIFETPYAGIDRVKRNGLATVLSSYRKDAFCGYLRRRFPEFSDFSVMGIRHRQLAPELSAKEYISTSYRC